MSKGLEAFKYIFDEIPMPDVDKKTRQKMYCAMDIIEKELKALEIIKKKRVNVHKFMWCNFMKYYNSHFANEDDQFLNEEEFELLKEVLCNVK